jgi:hypothetical protein
LSADQLDVVTVSGANHRSPRSECVVAGLSAGEPETLYTLIDPAFPFARDAK